MDSLDHFLCAVAGILIGVASKNILMGVGAQVSLIAICNAVRSK